MLKLKGCMENTEKIALKIAISRDLFRETQVINGSIVQPFASLENT